MQKILLSMFWAFVVSHLANAGGEKGFEPPTKKIFTEAIQAQPRARVAPLGLQPRSQETLIPPLLGMGLPQELPFVPPFRLETDPTDMQTGLSAPVLLLRQPVPDPENWSIPPLIQEETGQPAQLLHEEAEQWIIPPLKPMREIHLRRVHKENIQLKKRTQVSRTGPPISRGPCPAGFQTIPLDMTSIEAIMQIALSNPRGSTGHLLCPFPECLENQQPMGRRKGVRRFQGMYRNKADLKTHLVKVHLEKELFCPVCLVRLTSVQQRRLHMSQKHAETKFLFCPFCAESFELKPGERNTERLELKKHLVAKHTQEGKKWYFCTQPHCLRLFTLKSSLKRHNKRFHQGEGHAAPPVAE